MVDAQTGALPAATVHRSWAADLPAATLYAILRVRVDVFVVEQACAYAELDGRDLEPQTRHYWLDVPNAVEPDAPEVVGCARLLAEPGGGLRIGRLCTAASVRGRGLGRRLMAAVLAEVGDGACVLEAQTHASAFYRGYGFEQVGEPYDWDGVEHVTMRRVLGPDA
ncbi:GNAT family N-acetyltransferase [Pseudonocardia sp.]|uniref:GNAT family N-acetyltransferase n=1 Tax=Pseudonocardia sp. TaxID=60912 RepID=UPI003D0F7088